MTPRRAYAILILANLLATLLVFVGAYIFFLCALLTLPNIFVLLPDHGRFLIPVCPFLLFPPLDFFWKSKESKFALIVGLPLTYVYVWGCLPANPLHPEIYQSLQEYLSSLTPR